MFIYGFAIIILPFEPTIFLQTTAREKRHMIIEIKRNPRLTRKKINKLAKGFGATISHQTVGRIFNKYGLKGCRPVKAPYHKLSHRKNRVAFSKDYKGNFFYHLNQRCNSTT